MSKIGDLWVRLGLKSEDFKNGMKRAGDSISSLLGKLKGMRIAGYDAFSYIGKAVGTFIRNSIQMTQKWGDAWNNTMSGIRAAYGTFVRQLSSGEGWTNLFSNMRETYRLAKEAAAALDEIFERRTSYNYTEAIIKREIAQLDLIRRDGSKTDQEREAASKRIIELEKQLGNEKRDIAQQEADAQRQIFRTQTGMNDAEIDFLIRNYNQNRKIIEQGRQYLDERRRALKASGQASAASMTPDLGGVAADIIESNVNRANDAVAELDRTTDQAVKDVAAVLQKYDKGSDDLVRSLANAEIAVINVDTEVMRASGRATSTLGSLIKTTSSSGSQGGIEAQAKAAAAAAAEIADAEAEINAGFENFVENFRQSKGLTEPVDAATRMWDEFVAGVTQGAEVAANRYEILQEMGEEAAAEMEAQEQKLEDIAKEFNENVVEGFADGVQTIMDSLMGLESFNAGSVLQALLTPLADMAVQEGKILVAGGMGIEAIKKALESLNGVAAITAGAALIAVGTAAKSGLAALAKNGAGSTTTSVGGDYGSGGSYAQNLKTEMTIYVSGKISGNDIEISGQRTVNDWSR